MSIYDGCTPRQEVLTAELSDTLFAADFGDVVSGKAHPVYQDARLLLRNTYPRNSRARWLPKGSR